jgi:4'-phosphopantetheinyl transferase
MPEANLWVEGPRKVDLEDGEIHVWRARLDCDASLLPHFEATLSSDEMSRAERFHFSRDRNGYITGRGILRELLARYLGRSPAELEFCYGPWGKPFLRQENQTRSVQFNVSHSQGWALLAFAVGRNLGVDVEFVRADVAADEMAERYFSTQEIAELKALPQTMRAEGFFLCWTRKEAYIKARGEGLQIPFDSFHVSFTPGEPERLQSLDSFRWSLCPLSPDPRYAGALVVEGNDWQLRCWDWKPIKCG